MGLRIRGHLKGYIYNQGRLNPVLNAEIRARFCVRPSGSIGWIRTQLESGPQGLNLPFLYFVSNHTYVAQQYIRFKQQFKLKPETYSLLSPASTISTCSLSERACCKSRFLFFGPSWISVALFSKVFMCDTSALHCFNNTYLENK